MYRNLQPPLKLLSLLTLFFLIASVGASQIKLVERGLEPKATAVKDSVWKAYYKTKYALVIAASKYESYWSPLPGAARDADSVKKTLELQHFEVTVLHDPEDSIQLFRSIRTAITKASTDPNNCLLIYYAGHGFADQQDAYVVTTKPGSSSRHGLVSMQGIFEMVERAKYPKHVLIVLDACFSGKASRYTIFANGDGMPPLIEAKLTTPARYLLTSSTSTQQVPDKSIFCEYFIKRIDGAADAFGGDGYVTLMELKTYMEAMVANHSGGTQLVYMGQLLSMEQLRSADQAYGEFIFESKKTK